MQVKFLINEFVWVLEIFSTFSAVLKVKIEN